MKGRHAIAYVLRHLSNYKLRTLLSTLGVVIGVAAAVTFLVMSGGLEAAILDSVAGNNENVVYVTAKDEATNGPPVIGRGGSTIFTERDLDEVNGMEGVKTAIPFSSEGVTVTHDGETLDSQPLHTTTPAYFSELRSGAFVEGRAFKSGRKEVVLNEEAAKRYGDVEVGEQLTVSRSGGPVNATVVGIIEEPPSLTQQVLGDPPTPGIYAPLKPFSTRTVTVNEGEPPQHAYSWLFVVGTQSADIVALRGQISTYLTTQSDAIRLLPRGMKFSVATYQQWNEHIDTISDTFTAYTLSVGAISLIVGAIGIANIMLASVAERVKEIGIVRALGARRRDVLQLFLTESMLIGLVGSLGGVGAGLGVGYLATDYLNLPFHVDPGWLVLAGGIGLLTGFVSGVFPAWRAASLDPLEALRYE